MSTKKKPKEEKIQQYLVTKGTKTACVIFTDGSEGRIPVSKLSPVIEKVSGPALARLRTSYVFDKVDALVALGGPQVLAL